MVSGFRNTQLYSVRAGRAECGVAVLFPLRQRRPGGMGHPASDLRSQSEMSPCRMPSVTASVRLTAPSLARIEAT